VPQLLELQRVSSRLQGILQDYHAAFDLDILEPVQFARGVVAAHPHFLNPMMLGGTLGALGTLGCPVDTSLSILNLETVSRPPSGIDRVNQLCFVQVPASLCVLNYV